MSDEPLTFNQTVHAIAEFIEVAIHTILYVRQVYPAEIFVRRKKYETPVFQSRHPALNDYITGAVKAIADELVHGKIDKVVVVLKDKEQIALERYIFSIETMIQIEGFNKDVGVEDAMTPSSLMQYFRSFLIKLNMIEAQIGQMHMGDDLSFAIILELKDDAAPTHSNTKDPPPWIPAVTQHTTSGTTKQAELNMIRAVNTGIINLSLAVQESGEKIAREQQRRRPRKKTPVNDNNVEPKVQ
ncbi:Mitotic spindle assembly checkpoint protein MAD2B [Psilocybe cubensis]|uniref:Mitotic spindle assembly checkpoint protein MAD2B n=2 Tax=Psilocybe cubensis TaxID=181762 RepID=A0ACB8HGB8_PSICU|nr:Mitotic spindle assembly checkpoint protein MAD2B [Psilocybe cubensis]KAH9486521.1 Mitotic spindle assembly checkpoint protein MAD2B [Psilocybe cubensis]